MRPCCAAVALEPCHSDHLVLTSEPRSYSKEVLFHDRDWSQAWLNFIAQECGPFSLRYHDSLQKTDFPRSRFLYLLGNLKGQIQEGLKIQIRDFIESGGVVLSDRLGKQDLGIGPSLSAEISELHRVTRLTSEVIPPTVRKQIENMPFQTRGVSVKPTGGEESVLSMDGHPVLFKEQIGRGVLWTFCFDFGLLLTGVQQGIPFNGRHQLQKTFGTQKKVIEPEDLVQDQTLLDNTVPWADLFEKIIWQICTAEAPVPRWWYFPYAFSGVVMSTHDEEALGDDLRLRAMNAEEESIGVRSTFFIISDRDIEKRWPRAKGVLKSWQSGKGPEIGLHWNRFKRPLFKIRSSKFGMHEAPLKEQTSELALCTGEPVRLNRNHYLALGTDYGEHFTRLEKAGILYDSTYGPNQGGRGYLFGTGYPFWGMSGDGRLTNVLELPFQTQELWGQADKPFLVQLLEESASQYHQCVTLLFHPHYMVLQEEGRRVWLETLALARKEGHWMPTMGQFFDFFVKRAANPLKSRWEQTRLVVQGESENSDQAVALPKHAAGRELRSVFCNGIPAECREISNAGFQEILVRIFQSEFEIEAVYG